MSGSIGIDIFDTMPPIRLIALEQQVADKVCAIFELHGVHGTPSGRSRDLGGLAMLAAQCTLDGDVLTGAVCDDEARRRDALLAHGLPPRIKLDPAQVTSWRETWVHGARDPQFDFDTSLATTGRFPDPLLTGKARSKAWEYVLGWHTP